MAFALLAARQIRLPNALTAANEEKTACGRYNAAVTSFKRSENANTGKEGKKSEQAVVVHLKGTSKNFGLRHFMALYSKYWLLTTF